MAAQGVGRPWGQQGFDSFPQGIGDAPLIIADGGGGRLRGGPGLGHERISWCKLKYQEILRRSSTGIRSKSGHPAVAVVCGCDERSAAPAIRSTGVTVLESIDQLARLPDGQVFETLDFVFLP